jgi:hypothetical protein
LTNSKKQVWVGNNARNALSTMRKCDNIAARQGQAMKLVSEYLEQAVHFEQLAAEEPDPKLKAELEAQAVAYHKLAAKRAQQLGVPLPERPPHLRPTPSGPKPPN